MVIFSIDMTIDESWSRHNNHLALGLRCVVAVNMCAAGNPRGSGTFRIPVLFSGLRRFVHLLRRGAGRRKVRM